VNGLEVSPEGDLLGSTTGEASEPFTSAGSLVVFDVDTGTATRIGSFGSGLASSGDLAFSPDRALYLSAREYAAGNDQLVTVDPETGAATRVDPDADLGYEDVYGLYFIGDQLYGVTRGAPECDAGALLQIDRHAATSTFLRCLSFAANGSTTAPQPPVHP
jgi:hypothetical protein